MYVQKMAAPAAGRNTAMTIANIRKRDGRLVSFDPQKIESAIFRAFQASASAKGHETTQALTELVVKDL